LLNIQTKIYPGNIKGIFVSLQPSLLLNIQTKIYPGNIKGIFIKSQIPLDRLGFLCSIMTD